MDKLPLDIQARTFEIGGVPRRILFVEENQVTTGVVCKVYRFEDIQSMDLGVITIAPGCRTPQQLVVSGERTIEGYVSGKGRLYVDRNGFLIIYNFYERITHQVVEVRSGDKMQWVADGNSELVVYEVCSPVYAAGRFQDLPGDLSLFQQQESES